MALKSENYQPGRILHEAILGSFRANGGSLNAWCGRNGVHKSVARNVTHGQTGGKLSKVLLERIIEAAGAETVSHLYAERMKQHMRDLNRELV